MAQMNYLNVGQALSTAEDIKGKRQRQQILGMQQEEMKEAKQQRDKVKDIRAKVDGMPSQIEELESQGFYGEADQLRGSYLDMQIKTIGLLEKQGDMITEENYGQTAAKLRQIGMFEDELPDTYAGFQKFLKRKTKKEKGRISKIARSWSDKGVTLSQDLLTQDGEVIWQGNAFEGSADRNARKPKAGDKPFKMSSGDTGAIRTGVRNAYGSFENMLTGEFGGVSSDSETQIRLISEEASKIFHNNNGQVSHAESINRAMRRYARKNNIDESKLSPITDEQAANNDPAGLRGLLGG